MEFPDVVNNVNMILKKMKKKDENEKKQKYESCKRLENIMKKILEEPNKICKMEKTKLYEIEHPMLSHVNMIPQYYNSECDEIYNLIDLVNKNHPKINFIKNRQYNVEYVSAYARNDKLMIELF